MASSDCRQGELAVRPLTASDVPAVSRLAYAAGWNQTAGDIEMLLRLAPEGCFGIDCEDRLAATATLLPREGGLAWLGMVLTDAACRRRGFARWLVEHLLGLVEARGIATVKLDATDAGRPLYLSCGFRDEEPVERWKGELVQLRPASGEVPAGEWLLREVAARSEVFAAPNAYALVRPGARARYLGPFVAETPDAARELLRGAFAPGRGELYFCDILPANRAAVDLLKELGFEPVRSLVRMAYGRDWADPRPGRIYGIAGFELG